MSLQNAVGDHQIKWGISALAAAVAVGVSILAAGLVVAPQKAEATPDYAAQTKLPCGRCHVNPAGGGPNTAFGKAFQANGHKLPAKK